MRVSVVVVVIALAVRVARAESPPPPLPPPPAEPIVESYRATTLAMDGVALLMVAAGDGGELDDLALIGVPLYVFGPPIVHVTKGRPGRAFASLAMRVSLPVLGAVIGDSIPHDCGPEVCIAVPSWGVLIGFGTGVVAASALDAIFLAGGDAPPAKLKTSWRPVARPTAGGLALGIAGEL